MMKEFAKNKEVVLLVEDNPDNLLIARVLLRDQYTILEAEDGESAIELAAKHIPDVILMDINLPGIDGIEALKRIRNNPMLAHIPVIAITAIATKPEKYKFIDLGFDDFIAKPIFDNDFIDTIMRVLVERNKLCLSTMEGE